MRHTVGSVRTLRNRHDEQAQQQDWHPHPRYVWPKSLVRQDSSMDSNLLFTMRGSQVAGYTKIRAIAINNEHIFRIMLLAKNQAPGRINIHEGGSEKNVQEKIIPGSIPRDLGCGGSFPKNEIIQPPQEGGSSQNKLRGVESSLTHRAQSRHQQRNIWTLMVTAKGPTN